MSLHEQFESLNGVFFDTEGFAEEVTYIPQGDPSNAFTINAVVDWDIEVMYEEMREHLGLERNRGRCKQTVL